MPEESEFIRIAYERWKLASESEAEFRRDALEDLRFSIGDQWPKDIRTARENAGRPCLTMDQLQQSVRQVCNTYRQERPAININPIGDGADVDTAEIIQGIFRHIDVNSDAEISYDGAHEQVVRTGFGSWRLLSDYYDDNSDDQEVMVVPIENQFTVYWQPGVPQEKAKWCFIVCDLPHETYKSEFSDSRMASKMSSAVEFESIGDSFPEWATTEYIRVAEYFTVEDVPQQGSKRPKKKVCWYKINAEETLAKQDIPGSQVPVFTAYGDNINVDGKRYVAGLIRNAKDAQKQYNYMNSAATEQIALAPVAPWLVAEGQTEGHELEWGEANKNPRILTYKQVDVAGKPAPPPSRVSVEPPIQATTLMIRQASMDLKAATGLYDPTLGQRKGDESGTAIKHLQEQGSIATLNYSDNMSRAMRREGRVRLEWIKAVYDVPRVQRIIKPDGSVKQVVIHNGPQQADAAEAMLTDEIKEIYDIGVGRYDIAISIGPSYQSKRQEAAATMTDLIKSFPEMFPVVGDILVGNMDFPGNQEAAKRLKKTLPPNLQDDDDTDPEMQVQKLQGQLQQMSQQHELLTQELQKATQIIQTKQVESDGKMQIAQMQEMSKQQVVLMQETTKLAVAQMNASKDVNQDIANRELEQYKLLHASSHERAMGAEQHSQAKDLAMQQGQQDQQKSAQEHGQAKDLEGQKHEQTLEQQDQAGDQAENQTMLAGQIAKETAKAKPNGKAN